LKNINFAQKVEVLVKIELLIKTRNFVYKNGKFITLTVMLPVSFFHHLTSFSTSLVILQKDAQTQKQNFHTFSAR